MAPGYQPRRVGRHRQRAHAAVETDFPQRLRQHGVVEPHLAVEAGSGNMVAAQRGHGHRPAAGGAPALEMRLRQQVAELGLQRGRGRPVVLGGSGEFKAVAAVDFDASGSERDVPRHDVVAYGEQLPRWRAPVVVLVLHAQRQVVFARREPHRDVRGIAEQSFQVRFPLPCDDGAVTTVAFEPSRKCVPSGVGRDRVDVRLRLAGSRAGEQQQQPGRDKQAPQRGPSTAAVDLSLQEPRLLCRPPSRRPGATLGARLLD